VVLSCTVSETATYWLKIEYCSYRSLIWCPRTLCSRWNFAVELIVRKLESLGYSALKLCNPNVNCFCLFHPSDVRTDRWTEGRATVYSVLCCHVLKTANIKYTYAGKMICTLLGAGMYPQVGCSAATKFICLSSLSPSLSPGSMSHRRSRLPKLSPHASVPSAPPWSRQATIEKAQIVPNVHNMVWQWLDLRVLRRQSLRGNECRPEELAQNITNEHRYMP